MGARQNESGRLGRLVKPIGKTVKIGELGLARRLLRRGVHVGLPSSSKYQEASVAEQCWIHGYSPLQTARAIQRLDIGICLGPQPHSVINGVVESSSDQMSSPLAKLISCLTEPPTPSPKTAMARTSVYARKSWLLDAEGDTSAQCQAASVQLGQSTCHAGFSTSGKDGHRAGSFCISVNNYLYIGHIDRHINSSYIYTIEIGRRHPLIIDSFYLTSKKILKST
jgi:hypothetical protein